MTLSSEPDGTGPHAESGGAGSASAHGPLLEVADLRVRFGDDIDALRGVSFQVNRGESLAIVGETGSGKSTLALCLAGLIQSPEAAGSVRLAGQELLGAHPEVLRALRAETIAIALQGAPFNPVTTIGYQIAEPLRDRRPMGRAQARKRARELASEVFLDPDLLERYPHQLSGGERRRAALAMVLSLDPDLVVLDEPTSGLDPATGQEVVRRIQALATNRGFGLIVVSHNLPDATHLAARTLVLYAGEAVEVGATGRVLAEPAHPYTWALVNAYPVMSTTKDLRPIRGHPPDPRSVPPGCAYHPRCSQAEAVCAEQHPGLAPSRERDVACHFGGLKTLLSAEDLHKSYRSGRKEVRALAGVSLVLREGESLGIVGPSGSGKSTLARLLAGYDAPDSGHIFLEGEVLASSWRAEARALRRRIQLVMQDPWDAFSPRLRVKDLVREPLDVVFGRNGDRHDVLAGQALESVGLPPSGSFLTAFIHELSGGQLQRLALARALVIEPKLLVADEPTSMLDASEQARLLVVLRERQIEMGLGLVLVSHDLAVVRKVTDRILVLDGGRVVEEGPSDIVSSAPQTPTARHLIDSAPTFAPSDWRPSPSTSTTMR